jgi:membrane dipeptidase
VAPTCTLLAGLLGLTPCGVTNAEPRIETVDLHVDLPYQVNYRSKTFARGTGQFVVDWLAPSGVTAAVFPLFVPRSVAGGRTLQQFESMFLSVSRLAAASSVYSLAPCKVPSDRVGVFFSFEGMEPFARAPEALASWAARGVRLFGLVHSEDNSLASSSGNPRPHTYGLTPQGGDVVRQVHALGGIIDVSHASDEAFSDIANLALNDGQPIVASHSSARALVSHPRNLTDAQIRTIARTGGVVGINFHSRFLRQGPGIATLEDVTQHIRHVLDLVGPDHVAIGSDFEGDIRAPEGLLDVRGLPALARALRGQGVPEHHLQKLFGANARRLLCSVKGVPRK